VVEIAVVDTATAPPMCRSERTVTISLPAIALADSIVDEQVKLSPALIGVNISKR
jgi:hypothetical protein